MNNELRDESGKYFLERGGRKSGGMAVFFFCMLLFGAWCLVLSFVAGDM